MSQPPDAQRTIRPAIPIDLRLTLGLLRRGRTDPCMRIGPDGVWRATRTPAGPVTTRITAGPGGLTVRAWGPGSAWAVGAFPALVGAGDDDTGFVPRHPVVRDLHRAHPGVRIPRSRAVIEALVPSILEQKVVGLEARRSYARLVRALGEPAPGPSEPGLTLPPAPATLTGTPYHVFHRFGVERKRADAVRLACSYAHRLEETVAMTAADAGRRLTALPGVGPWTAAEVARVALGDTDAVSVGDYHLPHQVAWALAGEARADDGRMLELLEPYRGHRARVVRLIECAGIVAPRFGPRLPLRSIASM